MNKLANILLAFLCFFTFSCKEECIEVDVPYTEQEEYIDTEKEDITLTYSIDNNKMYRHRTEGAVLFGENPKMEVYTTVKNTSDYGGEFEFYAYLTSQGDKIEFRTKEYIPAGSTEKISIIKELNPYSFKANVEVESWNVIAPTKTIEKEVTKYRDVTKYRKCNTCVEDCGAKYKKESGTPWWGYLIIVVVILSVIGWILEKLKIL